MAMQRETCEWCGKTDEYIDGEYPNHVCVGGTPCPNTDCAAGVVSLAPCIPCGGTGNSEWGDYNCGACCGAGFAQDACPVCKGCGEVFPQQERV
jgi:hypothetical protein